MRNERWNRTVSHTVTAACLAVALCLPAVAAPRYKVLHHFNGTDGSGPSGIALDPAGNAYGTAGGGTGNCRGGCGLVFELTPQRNGKWSETVLYTFQGGTDGLGPSGSVAFDPAGDLYSTTTFGGTGDHGTVFELAPGAGTRQESVLHSFEEQGGDGLDPVAGVAMDASGDLYGTTPVGGANSGGTVYQLTPGSDGWQETILNSFYSSTSAPGGSDPYAGVILDASGNLYGTTQWGGKQDSGVVFELSYASGKWKETVLHSFNDNGKLLGKDGLIPAWGALAMDVSGALYGTTSQGGENICYGGNAGCGTIFKLTKGANGRWKETVLYYFKSGAAGSGPNAGVVIDSAGNLYGSTDYGGSECGCGVIYKLAPGPKGKWKYTVLHTFDGPDGALPEGNLVLDSKGNLYGGAILGGAYGYGVVFELTP